jgi:hypothetical protein
MADNIIISAHGGRWSDQKPELQIPEGSKVVYYVADGGTLSNSDGYSILDHLQNGSEPGGKVAPEVSPSNHTYDYACWYAKEFAQHCGIYTVGSKGLTLDLSQYTEDKPLLLSEILKLYPNCTIYWVCCRESTDRAHSKFLRNSPGAFLEPIKWTDLQGGDLVFPEIQAKTLFTVDVVDSQVSEWEKVLNPQVCDGEAKVTIAIIQDAVNIPALLTLASLIAYGLSRGYSVTGKKTGTAMQFKFEPKRQVSYKFRGVYTFSSVNDEDDLSVDAILMDKQGNQVGTLQITREYE